MKKIMSLSFLFLLGLTRSVTAAENRVTPKDFIVVRGARGNNLRTEEVRLPLGVLGGVCGASGSGKSTPIVDTVGRALAPTRATGTWSTGPTRAQPYDDIDAPPLKVVMVDQSKRGVQAPGLHLGVVASLRKRYASGLIANLHYTWGKALAYNRGDIGFGSSYIQDFFNIKANKGRPEGDVSHNFVDDFVYQIPAQGSWKGSLAR